MTDLDKAIWQASRGDKAQMIALLTELFAKADEQSKVMLDAVASLSVRIEALESRRGPGRPKGS
jgi:hypothetical protein